MRAVIYCRISRDVAGESLGVQRQEAACRQAVAERGWDLVADPLIDNDFSAYKGKPRPAYRQMMSMVAAGKVDVIVSLRADRLYRHPRDLEAFVSDVEAAHVEVLMVMGGSLDLSTAAGRQVARILGAISRGESETTGERVKAAHEQMVAKGLTKGGGLRPYGFTRSGREQVPAEADVIRRCAKAILSGSRLRTLVGQLNDEGIPTAMGKQWSTHTLKDILTSDRIAGGLVRNGQVVARAQHGEIVSPDTVERLRTILRPGPAAPRGRLLLTGVLYCANGHAMGSGGRSAVGGVYVCHDCPKDLTARARPLEAYVVGLALEHANEMANRDMHALAEAQDDLDLYDPEPDDRALAELRSKYLQDRDLAEYTALAQPIKDAQATGLARNDELVYGIKQRDLRAADWETLDPDQRRTLIKQLVRRVVVGRPSPGAHTLTTSIEWQRSPIAAGPPMSATRPVASFGAPLPGHTG